MASTPVAFILAGGIIVGTKEQNERLRTRSTRASGFLPALAAVPCVAHALTGTPALSLVALALLGVAVYLLIP